TLAAHLIAAAIPLAVLAMLEGLKGDAGEVTRLSRAADLDRADAHEQRGQLPYATTVRRSDSTAHPDTAAALGSQRRALPAGPRRSHGTPGGARAQTARSLAEAAACGRSSAAAFLQGRRPPAEEHTP